MNNQQNDFRGRTCGECAWAYLYGIDKIFECRRVDWQLLPVVNYKSKTPACPAFVPREEAQT